MKFNCGGHELELFCHVEDGDVIIDEIDGDTEAPLKDILMLYMQKELIAEYKRVCEQENGDLMIDRMITDKLGR